MKFENTEVFNIEGAMRGMRNPLNSWYKNDTRENLIGFNDSDLARRLIKTGPEHAKFLRQIMVSADITAPLYFYSEFDTYKVGTVANSCSTMHKLLSRPLEWCDFENDAIGHEYLGANEIYRESLDLTIQSINYIIEEYQNNKITKEVALIYCKRLLPSNYLQKRTITLNYAVIRNMYQQRKNHTLKEWRVYFCEWVKALPYSEFLTIEY